METTKVSHIVENQMFLKTSEIFAQQSMLSEEDAVNIWLDKVNVVKANLEILYSEFDPYLEKALLEISKDLGKEELIVRNEFMNNLKRSISKLISTIEKKPKTNASLLSDKTILRVFFNDLHEITRDVDRRIEPSSEVDQLLSELPDF